MKCVQRDRVTNSANGIVLKWIRRQREGTGVASNKSMMDWFSSSRSRFQVKKAIGDWLSQWWKYLEMMEHVSLFLSESVERPEKESGCVFVYKQTDDDRFAPSCWGSSWTWSVFAYIAPHPSDRHPSFFFLSPHIFFSSAFCALHVAYD